ncbi:ABC-three component system protein [Niveispirillum sp.]|uniref:ABC-three component system protein n=1 Tax=Niveispirillum sp. TaxID=1917217 RepID=UPI001B3E088C|nr:ABC-three component system protein [Niveispirillum sp.]MBP7338924.1 DUF2326 domain-containing protein [Niveispirillum sp.]
MIINSISSSLVTFKRVQFHAGLNVLLSDKHVEATEGQTRNSAGKTSLVEILHFLMGADCDKGSIFRSDALNEHFFQISFNLGDSEICVERTGSQPSRIYIVRGLEGRQDLPIKIEKESERLFISNENWKAFLGHELFGLPLNLVGTEFDQSYTPSFRSLISYFMRRHNSGGFISPERQAEKQQRWDWQENVSYLLGLDWRISFEFQKVRMRENALEELKKAAKGGALGAVIGTVAELRPKVTVAERNAKQRREQLDNFRVLESYGELSRRAARAKTELQSISRENVSLNETLNHLQSVLSSEAPPEASLLEQMYASAGIELPGVAMKRLEDVQAFYKSVVENRAMHLRREIDETTDRLQQNEARAATLDAERQDVLKTLESHGALEDFLRLQRELATLEAEAATLRERYKAALVLEGEATQLDIDRGNLHRRVQQDLQERKERLDKVILLVNDIISSLYDDRTGNFEISATDRGPNFKISIEGDQGGGIASMEIFCFDLALFTLLSSESRGPGFLVHDSHLFDGVDERQIAKALALGHQSTSGKPLQYIVTMNSDIFDRLPLDDKFKREEVVLGTRLSDRTASGGLFGTRF